MPRRTSPALVAAALVAAVIFCGTIAHLMMVRFGAGEDFPRYSTWRSDPLGAKALYAAFQRQPNIGVERFHLRMTDLDRGAGKTIFFLGATDSPDRRRDIDALNGFMSSGGRIVVSYHGSTSDEGPEPDEDESPKKDTDPEPPWEANAVNVKDVWKFNIAHAERPEAEIGRGFIDFEVQNSDYVMLPTALPWHSIMYFSELAEDWRTVYGWRTEDGDLRSVVVERPWGSGTVVLCSDTYLLSNEAMQNDRHPDFLAWLAGPSTSLLFDEGHLGTVHQSNTMALVRKYRLHGIIFTLLAVALLFVWKNATSLVPRRRTVSTETPTHTAHGDPLANLLRRHIPPAKLLRACVDEWQRDFGGKPDDAVVAEQLDTLCQTTAVNIDLGARVAQSYATICKLLAERKTQRERTD